MTNEQNFFDQPVKNNRINTTDQRVDYTAGCVLDCNYFNEYYKIIAIDLSK